MKQKYRIHTTETTVRVQNTNVVAVRKKDIIKKACRVIENGYIGIAGSIGDVDESDLYKTAEENLSIQIPYDVKENEVVSKSVVIKSNTVNHDNILENTEYILKHLREEYPEFDFSETLKTVDTSVTFDESNGNKLEYVDSHLDLSLILKKKTSSNLFDGFIAYNGRNFDKDTFIKGTKAQLDAYKKDIDMPEEDVLPVIMIEGGAIIEKLLMELNGERYGNGSSLYANKVGSKIFNDRVSVVQSHDPKYTFRPFFDTEGVVNKDYTFDLVTDGVLKNCFTNKKIANEYNLANTGAATGEYDDVPKLGMANLKLLESQDELSNVVKKAILVVVAAGGDFTPDGAYGTPVQKAFLYEHGAIIGTLPEFGLKSHINKMLGDDYIGTFKSPFYFGDDVTVTAANMTIIK